MNDKDADDTCQQITAAGGRASAHRCDVTSQAEVKSIFGELFRSEHLHILVNNAGVSHVGSLETTTEADFDRIFRVNVKGYYNCMLASVVCMRASGGGVILNIASIAGSAGISDRFAYSMRRCDRHDVFGGQGLSRPQHTLQLHLAGPGPHAFCRWISKKQLPRMQTGNV
jgi:2-keto-3-deoxy-L-fuconate dehydrogenase